MPKLTDEIKREIGQHFVLGFLGDEVGENITTLIKDYYLGNVIIMKRNVKDIPQVRRLTSGLQNVAKAAGHSEALMIGIDQENGLVAAFSTSDEEGGTHFPGAMSQASTGSTEFTESVSAATAREMKLAGINWVFSPVSDVNSDSRNPVIGVRSYGDDPEQVARFVCAAARGFTLNGVAPCAKHFPGHGDTHVDSHLGLPIIKKSLEQLQKTELVPFEALLDASFHYKDDNGTLSSGNGIATIMTGHMSLPDISTNAPGETANTPASLSHATTTGLLRETLGFKGVVVTDCLEMDAVAEGPFRIEGGAVQCLRAGADVVMICHTFERQLGAIKAVWKAFEDETWDIDALRASGERIKQLKARFAGSWEDVLNEKLSISSGALHDLKKYHIDLSKKAYDSSIAVIRDPASILPLKSLWSGERKLILFTPEMEMLNRAVDDAENIIREKDGKQRNTAGPSYKALASFIEKTYFLGNVSSGGLKDMERCDEKGILTHIVISRSDLETPDSPPRYSEALLHTAEAVIFCTRNADQGTWQLECLSRLLAHLKILDLSCKVVVLATCGPYDLLSQTKAAEVLGSRFKDIPYLASFEFTIGALEASARVIFGDVNPQGKCPVKP